MPTDQDTLRELFVTGLRNAHAVEKQALSIMTPQVARLEHYPEVAERLRLHIDETNGQIERLDELLASFETSGSALKDAALSMSGGMAAITHTFAGDEIVKNSFANFAFDPTFLARNVRTTLGGTAVARQANVTLDEAVLYTTTLSATRVEAHAAAVKRGLDHFGVVIVEESDGMGAGVRLKFTRSDVRQITRLEGEGGNVGSDDAP